MDNYPELFGRRAKPTIVVFVSEDSTACHLYRHITLDVLKRYGYRVILYDIHKHKELYGRLVKKIGPYDDCEKLIPHTVFVKDCRAVLGFKGIKHLDQIGPLLTPEFHKAGNARLQRF